MEVIALTTLFSVIFAVFFLLLFLRSRERRSGSIEQDSLLPLLGDDADFPQGEDAEDTEV